MADDADKPLVVDFDAEGRQYRATERASHTGADVVDVASGETVASFPWPRTLRERYGSQGMIDDTVDGWRGWVDAVTRKRKTAGAEADKALEDAKKKTASQAPTD